MEEFDEEMLEEWSKEMSSRIATVEEGIKESDIDDKEKAKTEMFHWVITPIKYFSDEQVKSDSRKKSSSVSNNGNITKKQRSYIDSMMEGDADALDVVNDWIKEQSDVSMRGSTDNTIDNLTSTQASRLIDTLRDYHGYEE